MECHEIWSYDDSTHTQTLVGLIALCPACHQVKHIGSATMRGMGDAALAHLSKVNHWPYEEARQYLDGALAEWSERSEHQWTIDLSALVDYGVTPPA